MPILNPETLQARLSEVKARYLGPPWSEQLVVTEHLIGTLICQAPGHPNDRHYHLQDEWWIVLEGEIDWEMEGCSEPICAQAGDFVFAPAHTFHHIHVRGDGPAIRLAISAPGEWHRHDRRASPSVPPST
jgi:quercetin dioxygenase-like cupin family protein